MRIMSINEPSAIPEIDPVRLLELLRTGEVEADQVIDVRESGEWDYYHLKGTRHIPMNSIPEYIHELKAECDLYIMCAHGVRSQYVLQYMQQQGFSRLRNVTGGISAVASSLGFSYD